MPVEEALHHVVQRLAVCNHLRKAEYGKTETSRDYRFDCRSRAEMESEEWHRFGANRRNSLNETERSVSAGESERGFHFIIQP